MAAPPTTYLARIPAIDIEPVVLDGRFPAKASVGEPFEVRATVFREGHDELGCDVVLTDPSGVRRPPVRMAPLDDGVARYAAWVTCDVVGAWTYEIATWSDVLATWLHHVEVKVPAGVDVDLMFTEGGLLIERVLRGKGLSRSQRILLENAKAGLADADRPVGARLAVATDPRLRALLHDRPLRDLAGSTGPWPVFADRQRALCGSWYEFFPRSEGAVDSDDGSITSGTFRTAVSGLERAAAMGFDVVYLPPIHPIGEINRKGPNNTPSTAQTPAAPDWVGSPWAIGSKDGGHDAIHPDLGTIDDFDAFVAHAKGLGLEIALDFALQAAPDHPWVTEHPEFFTTRADGTIAYAENPPKKYQDIYPINFDNDAEAFFEASLGVLRHWMDHGVRIFRVDNPHTKTVSFWERLLGEVRRTDPDVVFLAEAFTKPPMMKTLGMIGYQQSYTYFTWRTAKWEIEEYLTEVSQHTAHIMRPNFFVNTPDILHAFLQYGGPAAFRLRAALAATGSPSWGVYSGYELFEHVAVRPGSEEYLDSEKYQIRVRDWAGAEASGRTLAPYLTRLNEIRRAHPALQQLRNLRVHHGDDESILAFSKQAVVGDPDSDTVIVVINLDPHATRETTVHLDLPTLGLEWHDTFTVHDEFSGGDWLWGANNFVRLAPEQPAHVLVVGRRGDA